MGNCCSAPGQNVDIGAAKLFKPVEYQQRLEEIIDFWFRGDNNVSEYTAYDRETSLPPRYMIRWFKPDDDFRNIVKTKFA